MQMNEDYCLGKDLDHCIAITLVDDSLYACGEEVDAIMEEVRFSTEEWTETTCVGRSKEEQISSKDRAYINNLEGLWLSEEPEKMEQASELTKSLGDHPIAEYMMIFMELPFLLEEEYDLEKQKRGIKILASIKESYPSLFRRIIEDVELYDDGEVSSRIISSYCELLIAIKFKNPKKLLIRGHEIPEEIGEAVELEELKIVAHPGSKLSPHLAKAIGLKKLTLKGCHQLEDIEGIGELKNLESIKINGIGRKALSQLGVLGELPVLKKVEITL